MKQSDIASPCSPVTGQGDRTPR